MGGAGDCAAPERVERAGETSTLALPKCHEIKVDVQTDQNPPEPVCAYFRRNLGGDEDELCVGGWAAISLRV